MKGSELYWAIYKNLEAETIDLAKHVAFSEKQMGVYSMAIADLIVRCAIEIESLSKEMYKSLCEGEPEHNPKFDSVCLGLIENKYKLSQKEVKLCSPFFSFDKDNCKIEPFRGASKSGFGHRTWNKAYQALKHDRYASLMGSGTVRNLIRIMGALYLLNLYYRDKVYPLNNCCESFDARVDSDIFSVTVFNATENISASPDLMDDSCINNDNDKNRATYIIKFTDSDFTAFSKALKKDYDEYRSKNPTSGNTDSAQADALGEMSFQEYLVKNNSDSLQLYEKMKREAILNKHENIYPVVD